jgi:hypothetical protein
VFSLNSLTLKQTNNTKVLCLFLRQELLDARLMLITHILYIPAG